VFFVISKHDQAPLNEFYSCFAIIAFGADQTRILEALKGLHESFSKALELAIVPSMAQ